MKMGRRVECILNVNKLIYLMITAIFTYLFPSPPPYLLIKAIQMCEFLWHFIAEKQKNKWVKCIILTENENCVKFSG